MVCRRGAHLSVSGPFLAIIIFSLPSPPTGALSVPVVNCRKRRFCSSPNECNVSQNSLRGKTEITVKEPKVGSIPTILSRFANEFNGIQIFIFGQGHTICIHRQERCSGLFEQENKKGNYKHLVGIKLYAQKYTGAYAYLMIRESLL